MTIEEVLNYLNIKNDFALITLGCLIYEKK